MDELKKTTANAPVQNNTPEDIARIAEHDAATKGERLAASAKRTAELQAHLIPKSEKVAPT